MGRGPCLINMNGLRLPRPGTARQFGKALTLTELMCVIAIIAILSAFYLPVVCRAFVKIKDFLSDM